MPGTPVGLGGALTVVVPGSIGTGGDVAVDAGPTAAVVLVGAAPTLDDGATVAVAAVPSAPEHAARSTTATASADDRRHADLGRRGAGWAARRAAPGVIGRRA